MRRDTGQNARQAVLSYLYFGACVTLMIYGFGVTLLMSSPGFVRQLANSTELPLSDIDGIAVARGRIYVGLQSYPRIQLYEADGSYVGAIAVPGRPFAMKIMHEPDAVIVLSSGQLASYTLDGELMTHKQLTRQEYRRYWDDEFAQQRKNVAQDGGGNVYIRGPWPTLWPQILRRSSDGSTKVVVDQGIGMWLVQAPFPGALFGAAGFVGLMIRHYRRRRQRSRGERVAQS